MGVSAGEGREGAPRRMALLKGTVRVAIVGVMNSSSVCLMRSNGAMVAVRCGGEIIEKEHPARTDEEIYIFCLAGGDKVKIVFSPLRGEDVSFHRVGGCDAQLRFSADACQHARRGRSLAEPASVSSGAAPPVHHSAPCLSSSGLRRPVSRRALPPNYCTETREQKKLWNKKLSKDPVAAKRTQHQ